MTQKLGELSKLAQLSELVQDRELASLAEVSVRRDAALLQISNLQLDLIKFLNSASADSGAELMQYDTAWQDWRRQKTRELNTALATLEAEREVVRIVAKKAFGRTQAVQNIITKVKAGA